MQTAAAADTLDFVHGSTWSDLPADVRRKVAWLVLDLLAVSIGGRSAPASKIAADYADIVHPGDAATALVDGRRLSAAGAAWANGVLGNVLDYDDGHRLTKGHPGAMVIPAALAVAEAIGASLEDLATAIVVGYEVAIRVGVALHERSAEYHASAAWGAVGAAAAASRLMSLDAEQTRHALGLAEYHGPVALIMRSVSDPAMTKDAIGWGAFVGVSSAQLAALGYTATGSAFLADAGTHELGERWLLNDLYVKPYPACRWAHAAIDAALAVRPADLTPNDVERVAITTFAAAAALSTSIPTTTEEAQYNLKWPVAVALARGSFGVADALGGFDDDDVLDVFAKTSVTVDPELSAAFPARRFAGVRLELRDGSALVADLREARGEPTDPGWEEVVAEKVRLLVPGAGLFTELASIDPPAAKVTGSLDELVRLLAYAL